MSKEGYLTKQGRIHKVGHLPALICFASHVVVVLEDEVVRPRQGLAQIPPRARRKDEFSQRSLSLTRSRQAAEVLGSVNLRECTAVAEDKTMGKLFCFRCACE